MLKRYIIAGSQVEMDQAVAANTFIDPASVQRVTQPGDIDFYGGYIYAVPGWEMSPSIWSPREIMQRLIARKISLEVLAIDAAETIS